MNLERIEIVNGAVPIWGSGAEGGVINLIPQRAIGNGIQIGTYYGTRNTVGNSILAGWQIGAARQTNQDFCYLAAAIK